MGDLITYFPRGYEDRSKIKKIAELQDGEATLVEAICVSKVSEIIIRKNMSLYRVAVRDETATCYVTWFNQPYLKKFFKTGTMYKFFGTIKKYGEQTEIVSPIYEEKGNESNTGKIVPIYPTIASLPQNTLRKIMETALNEVKGKIEEDLPDYILKEYNLIGIDEAIHQIHFPENFNKQKKARYRLVFEELLLLQVALLNIKNHYDTEVCGIQFDKNIQMSEIINKLPFKLTNSQLKVLQEIDIDMESESPMNRLLQGDVGSGKTVISIISAYKAVKSGYQVAMMVPTAILARQHLDNFRKTLKDFNINVELLVSGMSKKEKDRILEELQNGKIDIIVGTHALLQENVIFNKLGLVVTDEQHRFGVNQRAIINLKGANPDVLVMSATPIPRTLALILYGDLDISIIDELPPNRQKIETLLARKSKSMETRVNNFINEQIKAGRQAYIVCPLVEENEEVNAKSVLQLAETYKTEVFRNYRVEYLHGKLKPKEKDEIMQEFKNGNIDILIATTVIEVGVDVPNANLMIIENSERFGLATLHQLRGRVGRGEYQSYCILKYNGTNDLSLQRLKVMEETSDGFKISEKDLELRGAGEFFGTKQHGIPDFKIANLFEDMEILKSVQSVAIKIIEADKKLEKQENSRLKIAVNKKFQDNLCIS